MNDVAVITAFGVGLCVGSFANVLVHRLPRDLQVVRGRSRCPHCRATIRWHDNIPLVSWLALGGRCRDCRARISWRYPALELAVAALAVVAVSRCGVAPAALWTFVLLTTLLVVAVIDAASYIIPHTLTVTGLVVGLALSPWCGPGPLRAGAGALLGAGLILVLDRIYRLVRGRAALGGGDVMLLAMIGAYLGPRGVPATLVIAAAAGVVFALLRWRGLPDRRTRLPFGPFLALAAVIVLFWGDSLWRWYVGLVGGGG